MNVIAEFLDPINEKNDETVKYFEFNVWDIQKEQGE